MTKRQDILQLFITLTAIASVCLGAGGLLLHVRLGQVAAQPVFVSPYFSTVVVLCGVALFAARTYPAYSRISSITAILAIGFARTMPLISDVWINGRDISANLITVLILAGAIAGLIYHHIFQPPRYQPSRRDFVIAVAGVAAATLISFALIEKSIATRQQIGTTSARAITHDLKRYTEEGPSLVIRMSERFSALDPMPSETFFATEFRRYLRDFPFFTGLLLVDSNGQVLHQVSKDNRLATFTDLTSNPELTKLLHQARISTHPRVAVVQMTCCERETKIVIAPISGPIMNDGSVVALIDMQDIVKWAMDQTSHDGYYQVSFQDKVLYQTLNKNPSGMVVTGTISVSEPDSKDLQFSYRYTDSDVSLGTEVWADFVWLVGIAFTLLLISSQRMTELARRHSIQLSHNALHDPLTGLPNRRVLEKSLTQSCTRAKRRHQTVSVVFFDVEGIKLINDSIGHDVGDEVLIEAGRRLKTSSPVDSTVTQLGSLEFVLVLVGIGSHQVQEHTENIIKELSRPYNIDGRMLTMAANAGIVSSDGHIDDPMELVRRADVAMLEARKEGKNTWHTYTDGLSALATERLALRHDLEVALEAKTLQLHYQPIVEGYSGRIIGVEALTRWEHETRGFVSPDRFISLAEETGQIVALTNWALHMACRDSKRLREHDLPDFPIVVNISPLYFQRYDFIENIQRALHDTGLPAQFLELEITESVLLDSQKSSIYKLNQLKNMGIRISIDDFGTGYSSLSYLKTLPIDKIKIDRSFITNVVHDPADAAITQAIISMAQHLNLRVVAEGVETVAQLAYLRRRNCDTFQGFLFARPMPFSELVPLLLKSKGHLFPSKTLH